MVQWFETLAAFGSQLQYPRLVAVSASTPLESNNVRESEPRLKRFSHVFLFLYVLPSVEDLDEAKDCQPLWMQAGWCSVPSFCCPTLIFADAK